jgi:hypothetical protein
MMTTAQLAQQKYDIITWLTRLEDKNLISDLYALSQEHVLNLQPAQIEMLKMSNSDIANNRLVSEEELMQKDEKWLY